MADCSLILTNVRVLTLWPERPTAREVVVAGGRFVSVGEGHARPRGARVVDLGGRTLLPGFIDSHVHLVGVGLAARSVDLSGARSLEEALKRIAGAAAQAPADRIVRAPRWDESAWPEGRGLTRADLDRAAPDRMVLAPRECGHVVVVNTRALRGLRASSGLDEAALAAAGADLPTGRLCRQAAQEAQAFARPARTERIEALAEACRLALRRGITAVGEMSDDADLYLELRRAGRLPLRACVASHPDAEGVLGEPLLGAPPDEWLWPGPVKVFADGSFGAHTAALHEAYADRPGCVGDLYAAPEALAAAVGNAHRAGRQVACHAIGDRGIDVALDAFEAALQGQPRADHRHRLEHCELVSAAAVRRLRQLGLIASVQPNFVGRWGHPGGLYEQRLGPRAEAANPFATLRQSGVPLAFGSDGMPLGPLYGMWSAVTHPVEGQRLTVPEALACATTGGAFAAFAEDRLGAIAPGRRADAVVLGGDPTAVQPEAIKDIPVEATLVDGAWAFGGW